MCKDFLGKPLHKGDWVVRAERHGSNLYMRYSHIEEEPTPNPSYYNQWIFSIVTYRYNKFGKCGRAERNDCMVRIEELEVPLEIRNAYYHLYMKKDSEGKYVW